MARGDWVPCDRYGNVLIVNAGSSITNELVLVGDDTTPEVAMVEETDSVRVERVVGQVLVGWQLVGDEAYVIVCERLRVALRDDAGALSVFTSNLFSGAGANEAFLWQRYSQWVNSLLNVNDSNANPAGRYSAVPTWSSLDVRVNRRLDRGQALVYTVQVLQVGPGAQDSELTVRMMLRTWAR